MTKASGVRSWRGDGDGDICRNCRDMPAPRGVRLFMKLNGCLPRSGRCTASATSHNAPLARCNQGMMLLRSSIRSNAAAAKSRRLSHVKKRYVSVVRSPHVHTRVDPPSARSDRPHCWHERIEKTAQHFSANCLPYLLELSHACVRLHASYSFFGAQLPQSRIHRALPLSKTRRIRRLWLEHE